VIIILTALGIEAKGVALELFATKARQACNLRQPPRLSNRAAKEKACAAI
jgi:hypothetical protein